MTQPMDRMIWSEQQAQFGRDKSAKLTAQCKPCSFRFACNGGCPNHRFAHAKDGEAGHNYFCQSYQMFFDHAGDRLTKMAQEIALGTPLTQRQAV